MNLVESQIKYLLTSQISSSLNKRKTRQKMQRKKMWGLFNEWLEL